jgi:WS/DGAT/MGAT family acyltransferase
MTSREPLSSVDFAWLRMDDPTNLMHINGVLVLDQPVAFESIRDIIERRLLAIPRFRSRVVVPRRGKPYWEPDPAFDIANHVGHIALPDPGGDAELREVVEGLISEQFDPAHPMWRFEVIQNFHGGTVIMAKLHHCLGDGVALMLVLLSMTDRAPQAESGARNPFLSLYTRHQKHEGEEEHEHLDLDTIRRLAEEIMPDGMRLMLHPAEAFHKLKGWVKAPVATGNLGRLVFRRRDPRTAFKGPLGVPKSVAWSEALSLAEVKAVSKALGGTINDVLLSAMTGGLRRYLEQNGGAPPGADLNFRAAMPVNLRTMERMDQLGNQFGLIFLSLPVWIADPAKRLAELKRRASSLKRSLEPIVVFRILDALGIVPRKVQDLVVSICAT